jgi:hypothetical protein
MGEAVTEWPFELDNFVGEISSGGNTLPISLKFVCALSGRVSIDPEAIPLSRQSEFLLELGYSKARVVEEFSIRALNVDGVRLETNHAYIGRMGTRSDSTGAYIDLDVSTRNLTLYWKPSDLDAAGNNFRAEYLVPGLRGFGVAEAKMSYGIVGVSGASKVENYEDISGVVAVDVLRIGSLALPVDLSRIDADVRRVLDLISLADGHFMRWSIRRILLDGELHSVLFRGPMPSLNPKFPLCSFLNLEPIVKLAVERYTEALVERTGLDVAIEWFLMHPRYSEAEFLTSMTALEHLIHVFVENNPQGGFLRKDIFRREVRQPLEDLIGSIFQNFDYVSLGLNKAQVEDAQAAISAKLGGLNQRTLQTNLFNFLDHYSIPISDLKDEVGALIKLRNGIVHKGYRAEDELPHPLTYYVAVIRELLVRGFMSLLSYKGDYQSYLRETEWKKFPEYEIEPNTTES